VSGGVLETARAAELRINSTLFIGQKPKGHAGPKILTRAHVLSNVCTCMGSQL
jgi:hypothetical protein